MLGGLIVVFAVYVLFLSIVYLIQRKLIYFPTTYAPTPQGAGVPQMRVVDLKTKDALVLKAWFCPPLQAALPVVLYLHGNAGHIGFRAISVSPFLTAGFGVLLVSYRGYSGNPGKPSEEGLYADGRAAMEYLKTLGVLPESVVLYGESIGTAVAIQMATEYPVGALILQSPFTSLTDVAKFHYPILPLKWLLKDKFDSLPKASKVHAPILLIHGMNDGIIPPMLSKPLFQAFSEPKQALYLPNTGHNDQLSPTHALHFINQWLALRKRAS